MTATEITSGGKPFVHHHAAHCETGVTAALFRDKGLDISEPMVFGIGSGIFFGHLPFVKWVGLPISTYRTQPGAVFRKTAKRLGGGHLLQKNTAIPGREWMSCAGCCVPAKLSG
ncbi:MAG TPA: BtrH N-terminal domain-containing protein [Smithella sp.]|nr:BtrH N-terminal domain-containing protein [Smithella sp.]